MNIIFVIALLNFAQVGTDAEVKPRIVKGKGAKIQKHPYSAFILVFDIISSYICGGSIINQKIILTAAHCFDEVRNHTIATATVGSSRVEKGRTISIQKFKVHPEYDKIKISNDIALTGLKEPLIFGRKIKKIILAMERPDTGNAKLAGWGLVQEIPFEVYTTHLQEMSQNFMSPAKCKKILMDLQNGTFCGGKLHAKSYPSTGDSGSPLVVSDYVQIGLLSYKNIDISRSIVIYTDVPYFYTWIVDNAKFVYCENHQDAYNNSSTKRNTSC